MAAHDFSTIICFHLRYRRMASDVDVYIQQGGVDALSTLATALLMASREISLGLTAIPSSNHPALNYHAVVQRGASIW